MDPFKAGRPARTYIQQLCEDTGCSPEDLPEAMNDREGWRDRVRDIRTDGTTRWWWYIYVYICWPGIVESDPKAPKESYTFPWIAPLTLDPYLITLSVKVRGIKYHFWVFGMTRPGIEPRSLGLLANTLPLY